MKWLDVEKERERERERGGKENGNGSGSELGVGLGLDLDSRPAVALGRLDEDVIYAHKGRPIDVIVHRRYGILSSVSQAQRLIYIHFQ